MNVLSIIGQQGSGKSSTGKKLAELWNAQFIEASDVVKDLCGDMPRGDMYKTNVRTQFEPDWLGKGIYERIDCDKVVLSGVRERENHDYLISKGIELDIIKLWAPGNERYARVKKLGKIDSYADFILHGEAEMSIGLRWLLAQDYPEFVSAGRSSQETLEEIWTLRSFHLHVT